MTTPTLYAGSNTAAILDALTAEMKIENRIGEEEEARNGAPPRVVWVPLPRGRTYTGPPQDERTDMKVAHLVAERDAKLSDLPARFALRVQLSVVALVCARLPVVRLTLQVQRRKLTRELYVRLPAGAHALDRLACDGCPGTTARPALCDDRLHVLCEVCLPNAQGRPRCPVCLRR